MIDIHIHILPGIDDGAQSWEDAMEMAEMAVECGVRILIATSHANIPGCARENEAERYLGRLEQFQRGLERENIPLTVLSGMEIFAAGNFLERLRKGKLLSLNQTRYVLIEFPMNSPASEIYRVILQMEQIGVRPVLAHPERYLCVQKVPAHVYEWYRMGAVIQINKGSVLGRFGRSVQRTVDSLLRHRLVSVAASDAHNPHVRTPDMTNLEEILEERYGCSNLLLFENPKRVLEDRNVIWDQPVPYDYSIRSENEKI